MCREMGGKGRRERVAEEKAELNQCTESPPRHKPNRKEERQLRMQLPTANHFTCKCGKTRNIPSLFPAKKNPSAGLLKAAQKQGSLPPSARIKSWQRHTCTPLLLTTPSQRCRRPSSAFVTYRKGGKVYSIAPPPPTYPLQTPAKEAQKTYLAEVRGACRQLVVSLLKSFWIKKRAMARLASHSGPQREHLLSQEGEGGKWWAGEPRSTPAGLP